MSSVPVDQDPNQIKPTGSKRLGRVLSLAAATAGLLIGSSVVARPAAADLPSSQSALVSTSSALKTKAAPLVLAPATTADQPTTMASHRSHASHASHKSHGSHRSSGK